MARSVLYLMLVFAVPVLLTASTYYVSNTGADSNDGSYRNPWRTLQYSAEQVTAGDTVFVENGTYSGFSIESAGTETNPIVYMAMGDSVIVNESSNRDNIEVFLAHYVVIDGFVVQNAQRAGISVLGYADNECKGVVLKNNTCTQNGRWGIFTGYAANILIENNETSYSGEEHGIYVSNSADNPVIRNNITHHNYGSGIQINADPALDGDGIISNALVENNICYENGEGGGAALNFASIRQSLIRNNILYANHAGGMAFWDDGYGSGMGCKYNKIFNNTVVMPEDGRWALNMINSSTGNKIVNNILIHKGNRGGLETDASSMDGLVSDYNILSKISYNETWMSLSEWNTESGQDSNSFSASAEELFTGSDDYHLIEGASAIDAGTNLSDVPFDFEGDARPTGNSTDIGADEAVVTLINRRNPHPKGTQLKLLGNFPNPFNGQTTIRYVLAKPSAVEISVYTITGEKIKTIFYGFQQTGLHQIHYPADKSPSGVYLYKITAGNEVRLGRFFLLK